MNELKGCLNPFQGYIVILTTRNRGQMFKPAVSLNPFQGYIVILTSYQHNCCYYRRP
ncbi:MAG: hypothetical protein ACRCX3_16655 [Cetobacterium sp.]